MCVCMRKIKLLDRMNIVGSAENKKLKLRLE